MKLKYITVINGLNIKRHNILIPLQQHEYGIHNLRVYVDIVINNIYY